MLLTISREKGCEYCVAAHSMVAKMMSRMPQDVLLEAVRSGSPIPDARLQALATFTKAMLSWANPTLDDVEFFLKAEFWEHHILGVILAIAVKTLSNYANHVFDTPVDAASQPFEWTKSAKTA